MRQAEGLVATLKRVGGETGAGVRVGLLAREEEGRDHEAANLANLASETHSFPTVFKVVIVGTD